MTPSPSSQPEVVVLSSVCGAHFHDDCQSCQTAKESNDHRLRPTPDLGDVDELVERLTDLKPFLEAHHCRTGVIDEAIIALRAALDKKD